MRKQWIAVFLISFSLAARGETQPTAAPEPIVLEADASEATRRIIHVRLTMPVTPGPLTLFYPKWIPGEHGPTGPISDLTGLTINAGGKAIQWRRDELDMYAIHCEVPSGVDTVEVRLDFLSPPPSAGRFTAGGSATPRLAVLNWNQLLLYPKGRPAREIDFRASLTLPKGWRLGTALPIESRGETLTRFVPVSLETLIDSPVICGKHFYEVSISPPGAKPHFLEIACDSEAGLKLPPEEKANYVRLVAEARSLFGTEHYDSYRFLVSLSDQIAHFGLEHHESSDNRLSERTMIDEDLRPGMGSLLAHEFVHSWNGKYRRPADMVRSDFQELKRTNLLWVYEGLTTYLGTVLATRSGLVSPERCRDRWAQTAEWAQGQQGRSWRPLEDTAVAAQLLFHSRRDWRAWRRGVDFYREGALIWLEIDAIIRQESQGRRSLDDFCRRFFAKREEAAKVAPFTFDDIVEALNSVAPHDWKSMLTDRVRSVAPQAPLDGLERSGWRLKYAEKPSDFQEESEKRNKRIDEVVSIGVLFKEDGEIVDVIPGKAAHRAGIGPGMKLTAINSRRWSPEVLRDAISATKGGSGSLEFLVENGEFFLTHTLNYRDGAKYTRLERDPSKPDLLSRILAPLTSTGSDAKPPDAR